MLPSPFFISRASLARLDDLVCFVYLVLAYPVQPNKQDKRDKPNYGLCLLNGFLNFAATETAGADPNAFGLTVDQCPDWLEVGLEGSLGLVIGMTDVMAGLATFATEIACICHGCTPSSSRMLKKSSSGVLASPRGSTYRSVRLASSLAAALLDGLFEHPAWCIPIVLACRAVKLRRAHRAFQAPASRIDIRVRALECTIGSLVFTSGIDGLSKGVSVLRKGDLR